jgi:hypothetical protein
MIRMTESNPWEYTRENGRKDWSILTFNADSNMDEVSDDTDAVNSRLAFKTCETSMILDMIDTLSAFLVIKTAVACDWNKFPK